MVYGGDECEWGLFMMFMQPSADEKIAVRSKVLPSENMMYKFLVKTIEIDWRESQQQNAEARILLLIKKKE